MSDFSKAFSTLSAERVDNLNIDPLFNSRVFRNIDNKTTPSELIAELAFKAHLTSDDGSTERLVEQSSDRHELAELLDIIDRSVADDAISEDSASPSVLGSAIAKATERAAEFYVIDSNRDFFTKVKKLGDKIVYFARNYNASEIRDNAA